MFSAYKSNMKEIQDISINNSDFNYSLQEELVYDQGQPLNRKDAEKEFKIVHITNEEAIENNGADILVPGKQTRSKKNAAGLLLHSGPEIPSPVTQSQNFPNLFRLFVKNGEYVYARANDIIMMESCDHLVKVYLAFNDKIKKTVRHNTLKDFLLQLPQDQFKRIGRFCAVNINRLSGGNCNDQTFEFDFKVSIKLKHTIPHTAFYTLGR